MPRKPERHDKINKHKCKKGKRFVPVNELGKAVTLIQHPTRVIFTGRSTMGKTTLAVDVIMTQLIQEVKQVFAACPTFWEQPQLAPLRAIKKCFTPKNVFTTVDDSVFEYIYKCLAKHQPRIPTLLLVDDAAAESATNKGNKGSFSRLCLASPHLNLTIIGVFQRLTSASPALRDNTECVVSFIPSRISDVDVIYREFNPCAANPQSKSIVGNALTECWDKSRYCFIYRPPRIGRVDFFAAFDYQVRFGKGNCGGGSERPLQQPTLPLRRTYSEQDSDECESERPL